MDELEIRALDATIASYKKLIKSLQKLLLEPNAPVDEIATVIDFLHAKIKKYQEYYYQLHKNLLEEADAITAAYEDNDIIF